ncbi:hypothetical protein ZWY2020_003598 [Hordeum vulgare]|nr:hypothetical protein ZWY2020_003598 [Hordeum vulgare]
MARRLPSGGPDRRRRRPCRYEAPPSDARRLGPSLAEPVGPLKHLQLGGSSPSVHQNLRRNVQAPAVLWSFKDVSGFNEPVRDFIQRWMTLYRTVENVTEHQAVCAFKAGVRYRELYLKFGRTGDISMSKMMEIANRYANDEEEDRIRSGKNKRQADGGNTRKQKPKVPPTPQAEAAAVTSAKFKGKGKAQFTPKKKPFNNPILDQPCPIHTKMDEEVGSSNTCPHPRKAGSGRRPGGGRSPTAQSPNGRRQRVEYYVRRHSQGDGHSNVQTQREQYAVPRSRPRAEGQVTRPDRIGGHLLLRQEFRKEKLTFEVVDFQSAYHAILGRPAYVSFMARPCYVYLKLKMPGPKGVITITGNRQRAEECLQEGPRIADQQMAVLELEEYKKTVDHVDLMHSKKPASESAF